MKKTAFLAMTTMILVAANSYGAPRLMSNDPIDYLVKATNLSRWSLGGDLRVSDIDVKIEGLNQSLETDQFMFYTGYDFARWLSVYGAVGYGQGKFTMDSDRSGDFAVGAGVRVLALDHDVLDTRTYIDRVRVAANSSVTLLSGDYFGDSVSWSEWNGSLTLSLINEIEGNKAYWFEALGLYGGATFQFIQSSDFDQESDNIGGVAGIELYISDRTSLNAGYEYYDDGNTIAASFNIAL